MRRPKVAAPLRQEVAQELKTDLANMAYSPGRRLLERDQQRVPDSKMPID